VERSADGMGRPSAARLRNVLEQGQTPGQLSRRRVDTRQTASPGCDERASEVGPIYDHWSVTVDKSLNY
jgi:hypothetical protein